jgi:polyhydroxyalkanoate synthesis regulator phasin
VATAIALHGETMALDKKQKKQIEAAKTRMQKLRQLLAGARDQPDDPEEITRLKREIADLEAQMRKLHEG